MIWFLDFERRFSSMFELDDAYQNNVVGDIYRTSNQHQRQSLSKQMNQIVFRMKKNSIIPSSMVQKEAFQLEHIDFQELYDDIEYKQLSKQSIINQIDVLTVTKYPIFCFFARILQIIEESIDESRHLKNWGIFNNIQDYINIERSVIAGLLIVMKSSGQRVSFYHALYRFHRILLGINDLRQRILVDINSKNQQQNINLQSSQLSRLSYISTKSIRNDSIGNIKREKFHNPYSLNGEKSNPSIFHPINDSKRKDSQKEHNYVLENENSTNKSADIENQYTHTTPKLKSLSVNKKNSLVNSNVNNSLERKISGMFKNLISVVSIPKSQIISESEREFLMVTYEIFYYTQKYSQAYLYDNVHEGEFLNAKLNQILKKNLYSSGDKNICRSSLSSGNNSGTRTPTTSEIMEEETEKNKLQQIFNLASSYLQENQQQYIAPRKKISSIDLDYNVNQAIASFKKKQSDGFNSTCSFSGRQISLYQQYSNQPNQFNNSQNISIEDTYMIKNVNNCFDSININDDTFIDQNNQRKQQNFTLGGHKNSYQQDNNIKQNKQNKRLMSEANIIYSQHPQQQSNGSSQKSINNYNQIREREFSVVGVNYLESLKQACQEQDDQVNSYFKMLLHRSRKNQIKSDTSLKSNIKIQYQSQNPQTNKKRISFGSVNSDLQNEDQPKNESNHQIQNSELYSQNINQNIFLNNGSNQQISRSNSFGSSNFSEKRYQDFSQNSIDEQIFEEDKDEIKEDYTYNSNIEKQIKGQEEQQESELIKGSISNRQQNHQNNDYSQNQNVKKQRQKNMNQNQELINNLSTGNTRKISQNYTVSLIQEEKEDSEQFNSLFDNSKLKYGVSPSTHSSLQDNPKFQEQIKQDGIYNSQSSDMQPNQDQLKQSNSSQSTLNEDRTQIMKQKYDLSSKQNKKQSNPTQETLENKHIKKYSSQQSEDHDDSRSQSSSSSSHFSSSSSLSSPTSSKQQSSDQSQRNKSSTISTKRNNKDKIAEKILIYQNQLTQKSRSSRIQSKRSHKIRKKCSRDSQDLARQASNSSSKRNSQINRTFDSELSQASDKKVQNQIQGGVLSPSLFNQLGRRKSKQKNPLQRRGGIQVKTVQKHLTKSGKEFDTLGVVKPNFNLINEIDSTQISQKGVINLNDYPQQNKKFSSESSQTYSSRKSSESQNQTMNLSQIMPNLVNKSSQNNQNKNSIILSNKQTIAKATTNQLIEMGIINKSSIMNQSEMQHSKQNQSQEKKNLRYSSQESISSGSDIKPKKKNSFFQRVLNFFHKMQPRGIMDQRNQSLSPTIPVEMQSNQNSSYMPPNLDLNTDKYQKRGISINGSTFFKIRDVINHEQKRVKISSIQQSQLYFDQSYLSISKIEDYDNKTLSLNQINSIIYQSNPEQNLPQSMQKKQQNPSQIQNSLSDQFTLNIHKQDSSISQQIKQESEQYQQFEKELNELFDQSSNQTEYDLQDRKNCLVYLYGKQSQLRQIAKKSSLNYKELSIVVDEEMNNENSLTKRLSKVNRGYNIKEDIIQKEINEEQFFTFPRESINYLTYLNEQRNKTQQIRINAQKYTYEYQIVSNQKSHWTRLRLFVRKAIFSYRIYLEKKQFYPKKKELSQFFSNQQLNQYKSQIIKDIERQQLFNTISDKKDNSPQELDIEFDINNFMNKSRQNITKNKNKNKYITDSFGNIY